MAFDWSTYLLLAEDLAKNKDEASLRSAISRAYYYVYHIALTRAEGNAFTPNKDAPSHKQLWAFFSGSPDPGCQMLAQLGVRLKYKRAQADYHDIFTRISEEVPQMIQDAKDFNAQ